MKALLTQPYSGNEFYNADCDYALITVPSREEVAHLKEAVQQALPLFPEADKYSFVVSFFCPSITMLPFDVVDTLFPEVTGGVDQDFWVVEMPDLNGFTELPRTECDRIHVQVDGLRWDVVPKHCEFRVTTREIGFGALEELA